MDSPGKNTGGGCHALLQGIFLTQRLNPRLLHLPALAGRFFTTSTTWRPYTHLNLFSNPTLNYCYKTLPWTIAIKPLIKSSQVGTCSFLRQELAVSPASKAMKLSISTSLQTASEIQFGTSEQRSWAFGTTLNDPASHSASYKLLFSASNPCFSNFQSYCLAFEKHKQELFFAVS